MGKEESKTEEDSFWEERIIGSHHYKTTISDGGRRVTGLGRDSEESQKRASDKWQSGKDESGGCIVATACIEAKGLSDNCSELNALRAFREEYVRELHDGEQIISEYYAIAPRIIEGINQLENPKEVYAALYERLNTTLKLVESAKMTRDEFLKEGLETLDELKKKYLCKGGK